MDCNFLFLFEILSCNFANHESLSFMLPMGLSSARCSARVIFSSKMLPESPFITAQSEVTTQNMIRNSPEGEFKCYELKGKKTPNSAFLKTLYTH